MIFDMYTSFRGMQLIVSHIFFCTWECKRNVGSLCSSETDTKVCTLKLFCKYQLNICIFLSFLRYCNRKSEP